MKRVLVQAGHQAPRQPGKFLNQTGAPGEIELVTKIQHALVGLLNQDANFHPIPMPGRIPDGTKADAAIFLHADGADNKAARGYSVGFPAEFDVNRRLAHMIADEFEKIPDHPPRRPDNNTPDMAFYYGYGLVDSPGPEVLVEHGFVTNPQEHRWLLGHVNELANAEYHALLRFFHLTAPATGSTAQPGVTPTTVGQGPVTTGSKLIAAPRASADRPKQYLLGKEHGAYSAADVETIVDHYYRTCAAVGLDPLLMIAQMTEETGHLTSHWSQRPRRNFAGIGVTGEPGVGLSFPGLKVAVHAHVGRLLAYALPKDSGNQAQVELMAEALAFRPLPPNRFGCAPTLAGLAGTYAMDPDYAAKLAGVANDIAN